MNTLLTVELNLDEFALLEVVLEDTARLYLHKITDNQSFYTNRLKHINAMRAKVTPLLEGI